MARKSSGGAAGTAKRGRTSSAGGGGGGGGGGARSMREEIQVSKSPAEFFAENQSIAGFDNMGRSLYTTVRELVENALDACESVGVLPDVKVTVEEMCQRRFNEMRGVSTKGLEKDVVEIDNEVEEGKNDDRDDNGDEQSKSSKSSSKKSKKGGKKDDKQKKKKRKTGPSAAESYFRITVRDNGCGMAHSAVPDLLGRVLSGSKYGVRQTRGKFGLGAKMALIWSKKSAGVPIRVKTSHMKLGKRAAATSDGGTPAPGEYVTHCVLDIDIYKNRPRVLEHTKESNDDGWIGTEFEVTIAGNWATYKSRIVQYLQQLAIITPYARLEMEYCNLDDDRKDLGIVYERRSEQMPEPATEVKHHPSSVNNLIVQQLLERTTTKTFHKFLCTDLAGVSPAVANRIVDRLEDDGVDGSDSPSDITDRQVTRLVQLLRAESSEKGSGGSGGKKLGIKPPDGTCLSPLGEYNLNLGIRKVIEPDVVATARDRPSSYDGHPFIVEAAVSLGGRDAREGISVVRFANRIPLLFEAGADVSTRVAQSKIKWSLYKIDHKRDKIGVFVSIVSTKVPFKGTGKEYIGDDITEIQTSVKRALQACCQQLRSHLTKRNALRDRRERRSRLAKHVPDVGRALFGVLDQMKRRREELEEAEGGTGMPPSPRKMARTTKGKGKEEDEERKAKMKEAAEAIMERMDDEGSDDITEESIRKHLIEAIESHVDEDGADADGKGKGKAGKGGKGGKGGGGADEEASGPMFLVPGWDLTKDKGDDIQHPLFTFRPLRPVRTFAS